MEDAMVFELVLEHETKGALCYKEEDGGRHSFYLRKDDLPGKKPERITLTVTIG